MMQLLDRQHPERDSGYDGLTSREMETLILVAKGLVAKEIARTLDISEKTVRNHISNIYRKLGIYDRSQLVIYAMKKGLVDIQEV
jgi:DNA-binding NarL/FixJ family response regulator